MATFTVSITADELDGNYSAADLSLREAVLLANITAGDDTIVFSNAIAGGTIVLTNGELALTQNTTIDGDTNGDEKADITISGNDASRIFNSTANISTFKSLTLTNGDAGAGDGGAISSTGSLALQNVTVRDSNAVRGGAIATNTGATFNSASVTIVNSTMHGNTASQSGGAIFQAVNGEFGRLTVTNSTIYGNSAVNNGGGIAVYSELRVSNSTITANRADSNADGTGSGGGLHAPNGGLFTEGAYVTNSVVADNFIGSGSAENDMSGTAYRATNSIFGTDVNITFNSGSLENIADANLGQLLDNGGAVLTCSPLDGSLLIGFGSNTSIPLDSFDIDNDGNTTEQLPRDARGQLRIIGGTVDVGAIEQIENEIIGGTPGNDTILGGLGNDTLAGRQGNDLMDGGDGIDIADYRAATGGVTVNLANTGAQNVGAGLGNDTVLNCEALLGSIHNDALLGNAVANTLKGGGGDDSLVGAAGADSLFGDSGTDTLNGGDGDDELDGGLGGDAMLGGKNDDTYFVDDAGDGIVEALNQGYDVVNTNVASHVLAANVERVNFVGAGNFVGTGNNIANRFQSGAGDDRFVDVQGGADIFSGGAGTDTLDFRTSATGAVINMATLTHGGAAAGDSYSGIEKFLGSNTAADTMTGGGTGRWVFVGGGGGDTLTGGIKNDQLIGQGGNDTLIGGADRDSLDGGTGNDTMTGGTQGDVFVFIDAAFGQDTITDYQDGLDSFKMFSAVADNIADFTITGNGTTSVRLTLVGSASNFITVNGATAINITADDFVFY